MTSSHHLGGVAQRDRHTERDSWAPALGPGIVLGALSTIGLVVAMFMSWQTAGVQPSDIPFAFLFDNTTTSSDPSILIALIPMAILLGVGTIMPRALRGPHRRRARNHCRGRALRSATERCRGQIPWLGSR